MAEGWRAVGDEVVELRKQRGWTQEELSKRSDVSLATIGKTERAEGSRTDRILRDLSEAFDKPKNYLSEIFAGRRPPEKFEEAATKVGSQEFRDMLDEILVQRLSELVVPHLNQIEHQLHVRPDIMHGTGATAEVRFCSTLESRPREDPSRPGKS